LRTIQSFANASPSRELQHREHQRLDDVVLGLQVGEDAAVVVERADRVRGCARLARVALVVRRARELQPGVDHHAVDRREEAVRQRAARAAVVEHVHGIQVELRIVEPRAHRGVLRRRLGKVLRAVRALREQHGRERSVRIGLQRLEPAALGVRALVVERRTRAVRVHVGRRNCAVGGLRVAQRDVVVGDVVRAQRRDGVPHRDVAPILAVRPSAVAVLRLGPLQRAKGRLERRVVRDEPAGVEHAGEAVAAPVDVPRAATRIEARAPAAVAGIEALHERGGSIVGELSKRLRRRAHAHAAGGRA